ncbi:hypothetical protein ACFL6I_22220 [candidate division KSB1 bacterium]
MMRTVRLYIAILIPAVMFAGLIQAQETEHGFPSVGVVSESSQLPEFYTVPQEAGAVPGGFMNGVKSLIFGPRIGLEANEGIALSGMEKINLFVPVVPFQAYSENGMKGFLAGAFLGPRVGMQLSERKIRRKEWLGLVPLAGAAVHLAMSDSPSMTTVIVEAAVAAFLSRMIPAFEAYRGKTMREIDLQENLRR